ncbi:M48 family metalloprotease [Bdellovibrio sp. HCB337]|uniref:M48 family metalloprotease n=1 Tax=Bdellovibrio sp. HCB337 TaxID=3394358 RepID=UPI0039A639A2
MTANSTKVWIFILISSLTLLVLGYEIAERMGLFVGFLLAVALNFFVFFYGESQILTSLHAKPLRGQDPWGILEYVEKYADHVGLPLPEIYLIPSETETAFCVSQSWRKGAIALTSGLVKNFSKEDLEAVIAHQVCSLKKLDNFAVGITSVLANALIGLGRLLDHFWPPNYFLLKEQKQKPFMKAFAPIGWSLVKIATSHKRFYENDLQAAELIHDRFRMAEVLWRLEGLAQAQPLAPPPCSSHLFIVNPEGYRQKLLLKSHPSIEVRLQKLMGYYPI